MRNVKIVEDDEEFEDSEDCADDESSDCGIDEK